MVVRIQVLRNDKDHRFQEIQRIIKKTTCDFGAEINDDTTCNNDIEVAKAVVHRFQEELERGDKLDLGIFVLLGFTQTQLDELDLEEFMNGEPEEARVEFVVSNLVDWGPDLTAIPLADATSTSIFASQNEIRRALHKSYLRGRIRKRGIHIRPLKPQHDEFEPYFKLRYDIYKKEKYILKDFDSISSGMEINHTDRTAFPIGAFSKSGELIGCIRLVEEFGENNHYTEVIAEIVENNSDKVLEKAWNLEGFRYPFDLCVFCEGFDDYYQNLVLRKVSKAEISRVIVAESHRKVGLGEVLVDTMIGAARKRKIDLLFLACKEEHERFYGKCGFRRLPAFVSEEFDQYKVKAIVMERPLT